MSPSELRVGNIVYSVEAEENVYVNGLSQDFHDSPYDIEIRYQVGMYSETHIEQLKPTPLTEEWLLRLGFTKYQWCSDCAFIKFNGSHLMMRFFADKWHCNHTRVSSDSEGQKMIGSKAILKKGLIKHVHQLQNLYFALVGEELQLKPKK